MNRQLWFLVALVVAWPVPRAAHAYLYPIPLDDVETEEDIYEIYYEGNLTEEETERLVSLVQSPVDLNTAQREDLYDLPGLTWDMVDAIVAYREEHGRFKSYRDLALVPGIPPQAIDEIGMFSVARRAPEARVKSTVELKLGYDPDATPDEDSEDRLAPEDTSFPSAYIKAESSYGRYGTMGLLVTMGQELEELEYEEELPVFYGYTTSSHDDSDIKTTKSGYLTDGISTNYDLAKVYYHTKRDRYTKTSFIIGSYRVGFGLGLVFDNTSREFPDGWRADREITRSEQLTQTSPIRYRDKPGMFGVAASLHRLEIGNHWISAHFFGSMVDRNSYHDLINDVYPFDPDDIDSKSRYADAKSLYICVRDPDSGDCEYSVDPATGKKNYKVGTATILDAFREKTLGANLSFHLDPETSVGVTAYGSTVEMLLKSQHGLRFAPSSRYPSDRTTFGAFGANLFWGRGGFSLKTEYARTDSGGNAVWLRTFYEAGTFEAEVGLRSYDEGYDNPWTSPYAEPDTYEGNRARDEKGINYRLGYKPMEQLTLRLSGDVWRRDRWRCVVDYPEGFDEALAPRYFPEDGKTYSCLDLEESMAFFAPDLEGYETTDFYHPDEPRIDMRHELTAALMPVKWLRFTLKPSYTDHDISKDGRNQVYDGGSGMKFSLYGKLDVKPTKWLRITAAYKHSWVDDDGPAKLFDPDKYERYQAEDWDGRTLSTDVLDENNPDCYDSEGNPKYAPPSTCARLYDDRFREDRYYYLEVRGKYAKTSATVRFKVYEEAVGYPSVVAQTGSYRQLTVKLRQSKVFDTLSGYLRYDLLDFTDDRVKWYQVDRSELEEGVQNPSPLYSRVNHQLTASLRLTF